MAGENLNQLPREERVKQILDKHCMLDGHFLSTAGLHLEKYIDKSRVFPHVEETVEICKMFAEEFANDNIEAVVAPAVGGVILGFETARLLGEITKKPVLSFFVEKNKEGKLEFRGGYAKQLKGKRALVLDDILTTGKSVDESVGMVEGAGAEVIGVGVMCDRRDGDKKLTTIPEDKLYALSKAKGLKAYLPSDCPMCKEGKPIEKPSDK